MIVTAAPTFGSASAWAVKLALTLLSDTGGSGSGAPASSVSANGANLPAQPRFDEALILAAGGLFAPRGSATRLEKKTPGRRRHRSW